MTELPPGDNVKKLPVRFRNPAPPDRSLLRAWEVLVPDKCYHDGAYIVDDALEQVACEKCGERLNAMWVLSRLADADHEMHQTVQRYNERMRTLANRSRTKCIHCQKITPIS